MDDKWRGAECGVTDRVATVRMFRRYGSACRRRCLYMKYWMMTVHTGIGRRKRTLHRVVRWRRRDPPSQRWLWRIKFLRRLLLENLPEELLRLPAAGPLESHHPGRIEPSQIKTRLLRIEARAVLGVGTCRGR